MEWRCAWALDIILWLFFFLSLFLLCELSLFHSSLYFVIFHSLQFSNIKNFRHTFSGTGRSRRLKLGTKVDSGQMYRVYRNQAAAAYSSLFSFSFQFSNIRMFGQTFLRSCEAHKIETWYTGGQWADVSWYWNHATAAYSSLYFFILLSLQFSNIKIFRHTFLRNCEG